MPELPDTDYVVDPDGDGPAPALLVHCDMRTDGGGWTIVFLAQSSNLNTAAMYTSATNRLLADAQEVLLAYRNTTFTAQSNYATFPMPAAWRTGPPMAYPGTDLDTLVSVDSTTPVMRTVRYGFDNFDQRCADPWVGSSKLGRICVLDTFAPFYNGFYSSLPDNCSDGMGLWNQYPCSPELRFSIGVR